MLRTSRCDIRLLSAFFFLFLARSPVRTNNKYIRLWTESSTRSSMCVYRYNCCINIMNEGIGLLFYYNSIQASVCYTCQSAIACWLLMGAGQSNRTSDMIQLEAAKLYS